MTRTVLLVEIGGSGLPNVTPVARQPSNWVPPPTPAVVIPPVDEVEVLPAVDSVTITWEPSPLPGATYVVWRASDVNGAPGPWQYMARTQDTRYTYTDSTGAVSWWKITVQVNGASSSDSDATPMAPVVPPTTQELVEIQKRQDRETSDRIAGDANAGIQLAAAFAQAQVDIVNESALRTAAVKQVADNLTAEVEARAQAVQQVANSVVAVAEAVEEEEAARIQGLLNAKLDWRADIAVETTARESDVESLALQIATVSAGSGTQFDNKVIWYFDNSNDGWLNNESTAATSVESWLRPSDGAGIRWLRSVNNLGIDSTRYRFVKLRVRKVGNLTWRGRLSWVGTNQSGITEARSMYIPEPVWNENGIATVDYDNIPWTEDELRIVQLEAFTTSTATDYWAIDWFAIGRPAPGAGVALVQQETLARQAADTAEATQRNTLAVQLRGDYTGNSAAAAQGMIGQVNSARIEGDRVISERTSVVEARLPAGTGKLASEASVTAVEQASVDRHNVNAQAINDVAVTMPALAAQGANMVINGGWEYGRNVGWSYSSNTSGTAVVAEGRAGNCWRVDGAAGTRGAYANGAANMDVTPGLTYRASCWYKTTADYNGTADNGKMRLGNQTGGQIGSNTFAANRPDWTYIERVYTVPADGSVTAFRLNILANNSAGTLWVDDVAIEEVTEVLANSQATQGLTTAVTNLEGTVASHGTALTQLRNDVDSKASAAALQQLGTEVTQQGATLTSQAGQLTQLESGVSTAQQAAQAAATAAGAKGKVIFQSAAPATADRLAQNLWIDTTANAFTPKRWNGTAWVAVTDKVATDAAAAAAAAQAAASVNAAAISSMDTRVTQAEGKVESQGSSIIQLSNGLQVLQGAFTAIPNGTFDTDTSSWAASGSGSSFSWDATEKALRSGAGSLRVANTTPISINPGDSITLAFRTKSSDDITGAVSATAGFIGSLSSPTAWAQGWTNWVTTTGGEWTKRSYTWEVPSTFNPQTVYVRFAVGTLSPSSSAYVLIDDVVVQTPGSIGDLQNQVSANAQATSALTNTVTQQGATLSTLSTSINQLLNEVEGKASSAALQALDSRVVVAEGKVDSQAAAMTQVQSQLGNIGGDNQLGNSSFENGTAGWGTGNGNPGVGGSRVIVDSTLPNSTKAWRWEMNMYPTNGYLECVSNTTLQGAKVEAGKRVVLSVYVRGTIGPRVFLQVAWYGESGGAISYNSSPNTDVYKVNSESWERKVWVSAVAPAGARLARAYVRVYGTNTPDQWFELDNVQLQVGEVATGYSPSANELNSNVAANAAANSALTTKVTGLEGEVASQGTAVTNVQVGLSATNADLDKILRSGSNMYPDGSFENRALGTAITSWAVVVAEGRTGAHALSVSFAGNVRSITLQTFDVTPERVYYAEAWVKRVGPAAGSTQFRFAASNNGASATYPNFANTNLSAISETEWTKVSGYVRVAAGKNRASLQLNSSAATTAETTLLWDDFVLMDVTEAYGAQQTATAAAAATSTLDGKVTSIEGTVTAQGQAITTVTAAASAADTKAAAAQAAAQTAADAAGAKGKVLYQSATPATTDRLAQNLWIDTTSGANTPKRWNGSAWVAVTDKAATDAAAAAAAAKSTADATATGLSATNAKVTSLEGTVTSHTTQINQAQAAIAGKADSSAMIQLEALVSDSMTGGGNMLANSTFADGMGGWGWIWKEGGTFWADPQVDFLHPQYFPVGTHAIGFNSAGGANPPAGQIRYGHVGTPVGIAITPEKLYCASAYLNPFRCNARMWIGFYDANNVNVGEDTSEAINPQDQINPTLASLPRVFVSLEAPPTARVVRMGWRAEASGTAGHTFPHLWAVRPMLEEMRDGQVGPSPWNAGGSEASAGISLLTDVNGNIAGTQIKNNGTTSEINMLANVLNVLSPGAVDGLELRDGYLRVWKGNVQRIVGNGFGPDALMDYFGPNVGAGNASKNIATMWMDVSGNAYWGGAIAAGIRRNAAQSTSTVTVGNYVDVGPFDTNGNSKDVVVSVQRTHRRVKNAYTNQGFLVGAGANTMTVRIYRKLGNGGFALWQDFNVGGHVSVMNNSDGPDVATSNWAGSYTLNDSADGTTQRTYRAEIIAFGEQSVTHQSGSFDSQTITQSLSLVSVEQ